MAITLKNTAPFVPPLISIGPEYYHLAVRTWRCKELNRSRGEQARRKNAKDLNCGCSKHGQSSIYTR